jgi:hypothetical protein
MNQPLAVSPWLFAKSQLANGQSLKFGAVAQLGERLVCNQEATGSIPVSSTNPPSAISLQLPVKTHGEGCDRDSKSISIQRWTSTE